MLQPGAFAFEFVCALALEFVVHAELLGAQFGFRRLCFSLVQRALILGRMVDERIHAYPFGFAVVDLFTKIGRELSAFAIEPLALCCHPGQRSALGLNCCGCLDPRAVRFCKIAKHGLERVDSA